MNPQDKKNQGLSEDEKTKRAIKRIEAMTPEQRQALVQWLNTLPEPQNVRLTLTAEFIGTYTRDEALRKLDAFREAVQPSHEYGISLYLTEETA